MLVLIVEDHEDAAEMLRAVVERLGHAVEVATSGPEGVQRARALTPDLVLCDIGLPGGMDGLEVARVLRAELPRTRLVAMTGYGGERMRARGLDAGFDEYLTKPIDAQRLRALTGG